MVPRDGGGTQQEPGSPERVGTLQALESPGRVGTQQYKGTQGGLNHSILPKSSALFHIFTLQTFFTCDSDATSDDQSDESKCLLMNLGEQRQICS